MKTVNNPVIAREKYFHNFKVVNAFKYFYSEYIAYQTNKFNTLIRLNFNPFMKKFHNFPNFIFLQHPVVIKSSA